MIEIGRDPRKEKDLYTFSQAAKKMKIQKDGKLLGRNRILAILRTCSVLDDWNMPHYYFVDEGYLFIRTKIHIPREMRRRDDVTLIVGDKGLKIIKKVVANYILDGTLPIIPIQVKINFKSQKNYDLF